MIDSWITIGAYTAIALACLAALLELYSWFAGRWVRKADKWLRRCQVEGCSREDNHQGMHT
jgi:hypothetical protein